MSDEFGAEFDLLGVPQAWRRTAGDRDVIVAIIDCGLQLDHALIAPNLSPGADFFDVDGPVVPYRNSGREFFRHGTEAAFVVAGVKSDSERCSGVAPGCTLMPVKFYNATRSRDFDLARSIEYAAASGAAIACIPAAIPRPLHATRRALDFAATRDLLVVVAAGNDEGDLAELGLYPAGFSLHEGHVPNQMVVMSVDEELKNFKTVSAAGVHIAAPLVARVPRAVSGAPGSASGSSISAPYVAGVAALVKSLNPSWWTFARLRQHLMESATVHAELAGKNACGGRVHAARAVLGPISLHPGGGDLAWSSARTLTLQWDMQYTSTTCTDLLVEYRDDADQRVRIIDSGVAQAKRLDLDLFTLAGRAGHLRLRSVGSNFQTEWTRVSVS